MREATSPPFSLAARERQREAFFFRPRPFFFDLDLFFPHFPSLFLHTTPLQVAADSKFVDLGADSLDTVEIMMALEVRFFR